MSKTYTVVSIGVDRKSYVDHIRAMTPAHAAYLTEKIYHHSVDVLAVFVGNQRDEFNQMIFNDIAVQRMKLLDAELAAENAEAFAGFTSFVWPQNQNCVGCSHSYWRHGENHCQDSCCEIGITDPDNCEEPVRCPVDE
ncbi:MAG: hypothetical protein WC455_09315 [Dehalococcoidia bacterium]|jgi:hypothetical protein